MQVNKKVIAGLALMCMVGCSKPIDVELLQERNGIYFQVGRPDPYSGKFEAWYENGKQKSIGNFVDGKEHGKLEAWYENGQRKLIGNFVDGKKHGKFEMWYENGQQKTIGNFVDGKEHGKLEAWYENGRQKAVYNHVDGKLNGKFETWYENGQQKAIGNYVDGNKLNGKFEDWYENGQQKTIGNFVDDKEHGKFVTWYENGQQKLIGNVVHGKKHGKFEMWYENGQQKATGNFADGKEHGKLETWHENGQRKLIGNYVDGELNVAKIAPEKPYRDETVEAPNKERTSRDGGMDMEAFREAMAEAKSKLDRGECRSVYECMPDAYRSSSNLGKRTSTSTCGTITTQEWGAASEADKNCQARKQAAKVRAMGINLTDAEMRALIDTEAELEGH